MTYNNKRRWLCQFHTLIVHPYRPGWIRRTLMRLSADSWDHLVVVEMAVVYNAGNMYNEGSFLPLVYARSVVAEYTDEGGFFHAVPVVVCGVPDEDGLLRLRFSKPTPMPDKNEYVYLKLSL